MSARHSIGLKVSRLAWLIVLGLIKTSAVAQTPRGDTNEIPPLRPPHAEIPPSWWELHGANVLIAVAVAVVVIGLLVWWLLRSRPKATQPPEVIATNTLSRLTKEPENGAILSQVSRAVRQYFGSAFSLPPREMTTREFCEAVHQEAAVGRPLADEVSQFLEECDRRKFARTRETAPMGAATQALGLVESAEKRREEFRQAQAAAAGEKAS